MSEEEIDVTEEEEFVCANCAFFNMETLLCELGYPIPEEGESCRQKEVKISTKYTCAICGQEVTDRLAHLRQYIGKAATKGGPKHPKDMNEPGRDKKLADLCKEVFGS